jgi:hypothetical protein
MGHFKYSIVGYHYDKSASVTLSGVDTFETPSSGTVPSASVPGNPIIPIKYYSIENLHPSLAANP